MNPYLRGDIEKCIEEYWRREHYNKLSKTFNSIYFIDIWNLSFPIINECQDSDGCYEVSIYGKRHIAKGSFRWEVKICNVYRDTLFEVIDFLKKEKKKDEYYIKCLYVKELIESYESQKN